VVCETDGQEDAMVGLKDDRQPSTVRRGMSLVSSCNRDKGGVRSVTD
jgi:hypothetical protein